MKNNNIIFNALEIFVKGGGNLRVWFLFFFEI